MGIAHVADKRPPRRPAERQESPEDLGLLVARRMVVEVVESRLAHRYHAGALRQLVQRGPPVVLDLGCVVGVDADGSEYVGFAISQVCGPLRGGQVCA